VSNPSRSLTKNRKNHEKPKFKSGGGSPGRIRTSDQPVNSQVIARCMAFHTGASDCMKRQLFLHN
jgi:hypothetical protein